MAFEADNEHQRQRRESSHVDVDHAQLLVAITRRCCAEQTEARIVDDVARLNIGCLPRSFDLRRGLWLGEIGDDHQRPFACTLLDLGRERFEPYLAAGDQRERMAIAREYAG